MTCAEAEDLITALVDGELAGPERELLESHLHECAHCRAIMEEENAVRQKVRSHSALLSAPAPLRRKILADERILPEPMPRWWEYFWLRPGLAGGAFIGLILAIALPTFFALKTPREPLAAAALETYARFARGELSVERTENPKEVVAQLTKAVGGELHPMGYDFSTVDLKPVAGLVREINGRKILIAIYQGPGGTLFCYTFFGSEADAPAEAARFLDSARRMSFYAFSQGKVNAVLHREGQIICILASEMPMDDLLALARSKAQKN